MAKLDKDQEVQKRLRDATQIVREYAGSDCSRNVIEMLDAIGQSYTMDLVHCTVDDLVRIQSALKQVFAIRNVLAAEGFDIPKI
jgi:homoserine acetyltransferase